MAEIVDNQPEMTLDSPEFAEQMASIGVTVPEKEGVKEADSSPEPAKDKVEDTKEDESPAGLKAQIRGLKAELTRRTGNADKVSDLEDQLQSLQGQLKAINERPQPTVEKDEVKESIAKLDDRGVISKLTDWQDELADARAKYNRYEETGDDQKLQHAAQRIQHAKRVISALHEETVTRQERKAKEAEELQSEAQSINSELTSMYEAVNEVFPDFTNPETDLWKAGNEEFINHPKLMARMGPAGELVAAALAVVKHPELRGKDNSAKARRDVLNKIDKGLSKALSGGATSPSTGRSVDYGAAINQGGDLAAFNKIIDDIKGGVSR